MGLFAREARALRTAVLFFTRIPLPAGPGLSADDLRRSAAYFPAIGWIVGGAGAGVFWAASRVLPTTVAAGLCLTATALLTGAMHEDALADVCDGFGGGATRERVLEIMKDSHVGAFGVVGLILAFGLRWQALATLPLALAPAVILAAHTISRAASISLMATLDYVREGPSKARALSSRLSLPRIALTLVAGLAPLLLLPLRLWWALVPVALVRILGAAWFRRRIGGYTGDCLGALQQVAEIVFLIAVGVLSWR